MSACRVFLVGEGPSDIGDLANPPSYRDEDDRREGYLQPIVRKLVGPIEVMFFDGRRLVALTPPPESFAAFANDVDAAVDACPRQLEKGK